MGKIEEYYDLIIIGGGPAGLAAAVAAKREGAGRLLILERDHKLGGILNQCIHNGFGLHTFKEELTGPEYASRFIRMVEELEIPYLTDTMVMGLGEAGQEITGLEPEAAGQGITGLEPGVSGQKWKQVTILNRALGLQQLLAKAVILAMGCRERPRGALNIPGYRPAGIFSAGTAQKYVNIDGKLPGREVVILGSGDIGLIMARRMTLEGAKVKVVAELMPYSGGLKRNIVQCLDDYGIPLRLSTTVVDIDGKDRVKGVTLAKVDGSGRPVAGTEEYVSCDTLLLSVGLIPENELSTQAGVKLQGATSGPEVDESLETNLPGVFACGNVLHVHDLVDYVSEEAGQAGRNAARYCHGELMAREAGGLAHGGGEGGERGEGGENAAALETLPAYPDGIRIRPESGVRYTVPSLLYPQRCEEEILIRFRVGRVFRDVEVVASLGGREIVTRKRRAMAPGEMEEIRIRREWLGGQDGPVAGERGEACGKPVELILAIRPLEAADTKAKKEGRRNG